MKFSVILLTNLTISNKNSDLIKMTFFLSIQLKMIKITSFRDTITYKKWLFLTQNWLKLVKQDKITFLKILASLKLLRRIKLLSTDFSSFWDSYMNCTYWSGYKKKLATKSPTTQKIKFCIYDFFRKFNQAHSIMWILSRSLRNI